MLNLVLLAQRWIQEVEYRQIWLTQPFEVIALDSVGPSSSTTDWQKILKMTNNYKELVVYEFMHMIRMSLFTVLSFAAGVVSCS